MNPKAYSILTNICFAAAIVAALLYDRASNTRPFAVALGALAGATASVLYFHNQFRSRRKRRPAKDAGVRGASGSRPEKELGGGMGVSWVCRAHHEDLHPNLMPLFRAYWAAIESSRQSRSAYVLGRGLAWEEDISGASTLEDVRRLLKGKESYEITLNPDGSLTYRIGSAEHWHIDEAEELQLSLNPHNAWAHRWERFGASFNPT